MLIPSHRHTARDLEAWSIAERTDAVVAQSRRMAAYEAKALVDLRSFEPRVDCYVGTSWGKESVVVAHLAWRIDPAIRLVWFPAGRIENPDCHLVRDAFLARWPMAYSEIDAGPTGATDDIYGHDGAQAEFEAASRGVAGRYVSGVRAEESAARKRRMQTYGASTERTCAPLGWWPIDVVYAYLCKYELPVHPAYACTMGGLLERWRIRVATIGGRRGRGHGRAEWERRYYGAELHARGVDGSPRGEA